MKKWKIGRKKNRNKDKKRKKETKRKTYRKKDREWKTERNRKTDRQEEKQREKLTGTKSREDKRSKGHKALKKVNLHSIFEKPCAVICFKYNVSTLNLCVNVSTLQIQSDLIRVS